MGNRGTIAQDRRELWPAPSPPAFFVHSGEASHATIGMITRDERVLALYELSAKPDEILTITPRSSSACGFR